MNDREKSFFLYGFGLGVRMVNPSVAALAELAMQVFEGREYMALLLEAKSEADGFARAAFGAPVDGKLWDGGNH